MSMSTRVLGAVALSMLITTGPAALAAPAKPALPKVDIKFDEFTLPNGLRVIVHTDRKAPIVAVNVWYHVGSKNEPLGRSGFAHLFEHLMFQGSENHKGEFFDPFVLVGTTGQNGTTNQDRTNYFENVPTPALDMALWMESDRMGHLVGAIDQAQLDEQRGVVQNEKRLGENRPYGQAEELLYKATYPDGHPYHHTVIGSMADLNAATLDDVKGWFRSWYGPNNAVLVLAGDIDLATAKAKVARYFGDIAPTATVKKMKAQIAARTTSTREQIADAVPQTRIYRVWNVPAEATADADRLRLLAYVLGGARSSRLDRRLTHGDKTVDHISASIDASEIGGQFTIQADVKAGGDPAVVEKAIDEELRALLKSGPTAVELAQAKTYFAAGFVRGVERIGGFGGKADVLAECAVFTGKAGCFKDSLATFANATAGQLKAVGAKWLTKGEHTLTIVPGKRTPLPEAAAIANLPPTVVPPAAKSLKTIKTDVDRTKGVPSTDTFPPLVFPTLSRATLSNGLKVVLAERHGLPLVQMSLDVQGAGFSSDAAGKAGEASFAMGMLDEGAGNYDSLALGDRLDALGAQLATGAGLDQASLYLSSLTTNLEPSLAVFADVLMRPTFDATELERVRASWLAGIKQEKAQPGAVAGRVLPALLYGAGHPYATPASGSGTEASIAALTRDELRAWVGAHLRPDRATLIVVGDTTLAALQPKLEAAFASWKAPATPAAPLALPTVKLPAKARVFLIDQPGAIQANITVAQLVPPSTDAGAIDLEFANDIVGGDFSARINMNLREDKHWAYGAYSRVGSALGQRRWGAGAAVQIDKTVDSVKELEREIRTFATGAAPAKPAEITRVQSGDVRELPGAYETAAAVMGTISGIVLYQRPDDYPAVRAARETAIKSTDIAAAAATIKPASLTWVIVGDLSKIEPGIRALKLGDVKVIDADGKILR
ncbi:MAG: insulinase family protein [Deltaproteobacteria bacterium]|nr:insulinase family protein [Deltaproteobacteria bacterium]